MRTVRLLGQLSHALAVLLAVPEPAAVRLSYGAVELRWQAPAECPDAASIDARVRSDLATVPDRRDPLSILIDDEVRVTDDGRFALSSRTTSATGSEQRRWVADACSTLAEIAAAQALSAIDQSIAEALPPLDPNAAPARAPVPPPLLPAIVDDPVAPASTDAAPRAPARSIRRVRVALRPTLGLEIGALDGVGPTAGLAAAVLTRRVRAEAAIFYFMPRYIDATGGVGAVLQLVTVGARVCPRVVLPRLELAVPCVGLEVGGAIGRGVGVDDPRSDTVLWAAAQLGPMIGVRVHPRLSVTADAHAAFPLGTPTFAMREQGTVWRASIGARVLVGLEIRLR